MNILILRMQAPLMSFGGVSIDQHRGTERHPYKSMVVGILGNALGLLRTQGPQMQSLQSEIDIASRLDRPGKLMSDFQTAFLGNGDDKDARPSFVEKAVWSSRGKVIKRTKNNITYLMNKDYRADASVTVAVSASPALIERLSGAVQRPARPIFLGRKACLPSRPLFEALVEAEDAPSAVLSYPLAEEVQGESISLMWDSRHGNKGLNGIEREVHDLKDWVNGVHVGSRKVFEAFESGVGA